MSDRHIWRDEHWTNINPTERSHKTLTKRTQ